jgi:hypothetical protein
LFADGDLPADEFGESGNFLAGQDAVVDQLDDRTIEKLPPELLGPHLPDDLGPVRLDLSPALIELILQRMQAERSIEERAAALGWAGQPTSDFSYTGNGGYTRHFENASIYWTKSFGAKEVHGAIRDRYRQMGGEKSYLGYPQTDELSSAGAGGQEVRYSNFQGGTIYWTATRGAFLLPSFSPITERHQLGAWVYMVGSGFTPNSRVSYWIVNTPDPPKSLGAEYAAADGRVGANPSTRYVVDLRNLGGDRPPSVARAVDEATGQVSDHQLSYALY